MYLDLQTDYEFDTVKDMAVQLWKNEDNDEKFSNVDVRFESVTGYPIFRFTDADGKACTFWDFSHKIRMSNGTLKMYLLTEKLDTSSSKTSKSSRIADSAIEEESDIENSKSIEKISDIEKSKSVSKVAKTTKIDANSFPFSVKNLNVHPGTASDFDSLNCTVLNDFQNKDVTLNQAKYCFDAAVEIRKKKDLGLQKPFSTDKSEKTVEIFKSPPKKKPNSSIAGMKLETLPPSKNFLLYEVVEMGSSKSVRIITDNSMLFKCEQKGSALKSLHLSVPITKIEKLDFKPFASEQIVGAGGFGTVRKAVLSGTTVVAKTMNSSNQDKYILRELILLDRVRHQNIVQLMSVAIEPDRIHLILEYFKSSNLRKILNESEFENDYHLNIPKKSRICHQLCMAINYIHNLSPIVLHKDIKPENILVNTRLYTKICDFGMGKSAEMPEDIKTCYGKNVMGTIPYLAPEILVENKPATMYSDIWSLGCVIIELFTEKMVWENFSDGTDPEIKRLLKMKQQPSLDKVPPFLKTLLAASLSYEPDKRCNAEDFLKIFELENSSRGEK